MRSRAFKGEIHRNRFLTNWAVAYLTGSKVEIGTKRLRLLSPSTKPLKLILSLITVLVVMATFLYQNIFPTPRVNLFERQQLTARNSISLPVPAAANKLTNNEECTETNLRVHLSPAIFEPSAIPDAPNFSISHSEKLGGVIFATYICLRGTGEFNAEWERKGNDWTLKKISRQPGRQPGDL